jgi:uncharacterized protein YecE (DUF72 family)
MARRKQTHETPSLFAAEQSAPPSQPSGAPSEYVARNRERIHRWASRGINFGSSSWKYPGWKGQVYNRRYPNQKVFERECLAEYAELFPTVCADFALYDFPDPETMQLIHDQTGEGFTVSLKVTDRITIKRYPNLPRHGKNAGRENPDFLNLQLFEEAFLRPLEHLRQKVGVIIFEFSTFYPPSGITAVRFTEMMDAFLSRLPKGYAYAVEVRNSEFLTPEYLAMLASRGTAHVLNSWTRMPSVIEQISMAGILTAPFAAARGLLKPGRTYQEAVDMFSPYREIREKNPELRLGLAQAVQRCLADGRTLYAYLNNRAEGNSPKTIEGILDVLDSYPVETL